MWCKFSFFLLCTVLSALCSGAKEQQERPTSSGRNGSNLSDGDLVVTSSSEEKEYEEEKSRVGDNVEFPPMFVLNLDRASDRWAQVQKQMSEQGLEVERLSAVDGKKLTDAEMQTHSTKMAAFLQPRGVIGCYLSHKKFWQMVVDRNLDSAIIFEDDVRLVDNFKDTLRNYLERLRVEGNKPYDVLLLGAIGRVHPEGRDNLGSMFFSNYIGGKRKREVLSPFLYKPRRPAGTHAYMVSNAGARRLLGLCPKATFHVDLDVRGLLLPTLPSSSAALFLPLLLPRRSSPHPRRPGGTETLRFKCSTRCWPTRRSSRRR